MMIGLKQKKQKKIDPEPSTARDTLSWHEGNDGAEVVVAAVCFSFVYTSLNFNLNFNQP
jgi:hypothetical protein